jgi:hypothetical protein
MTPEQIIYELERQNRRFRQTGTAVLVTALVALVVSVGLLATGRAGAQSTPKPGVLTGSEFRLVDSSGITRAKLMMENGNPILRFLSEEGKPRAAIGLQTFGPILSFLRENGRPGASLGVTKNVSSMAFGDSASHVRIMLVVDSTGAPTIALRDTTGHTAWTAPKPPER